MSTYSEIVAEIRAERERQVAVEGYSENHDNDHANGELATAADIYFKWAVGATVSLDSHDVPMAWPWGKEYWKPKQPRRMLIIAAALYRAEIDRLKRRKDRYEHLESKVESCINHILYIDDKE